jgi:enoyl-CoA hydratase/carnithine racemase
MVLYEASDGIALVTINRSEVLNAINREVSKLLLEAFAKAEADDEVRAIILTGRGRAFSAGGDMNESSAAILASAEADPGQARGESDGPSLVHHAIWDLSKPVIAAVKGYAIGQACELAGVCDFTVAADDAKFGEIQIRHGYGPPFLITPYLTTMKRAKEILMLGELMDANEAKLVGLVNRVVPADEVMDMAMDMAKKLASLPNKTMRMNKALINRTYELRGFGAGVNYRDDETFMELWTGSQRDEETLSRLRVLQERGWNAFRNERDAAYRDERGG